MIRVGLIGGTALVLAACPEDAADITEVASEPSIDFPVVAAYVEPVGSFSIERFLLADFDASVSDAFGRSNENFTDYPVFYEDYGWAMGGGEGTQPIGTADVDTRKPLLTMATASYVYDYADINAYYVNEGDWDFYGYFCCVTPGTEYVAGLERNALQVNAELDAEAVLLGQPITDPDSLFWLGGAPGGDHTRAADLWNLNDPYFAEQNANPYIFGYVSADADGEVLLDCVVSHADAGGATVWMATTADPDQDLSIVAPNQLVHFDFPNYNYLTFWERNPDGTPDYSRPLARYQMGVDLDASGNPINNALAPFPDRAATDEEKLFGPGGAGKPDSLVMTFNRLQALTGGAAYEPWLVSPLTGSMVPASGTYYRIKLIPVLDPVTGEVIEIDEETVETVSDASGFVGGNEEDGYRHALVISDASLAAGDSIGLHTHVMLTITDSPGGATPSDSRPLWFAYTDQNDTPDNYFDDSFNPDNGITTFGNFNASDPTASLKFGAEGKGTGGVREDVLSVDLRNLSRPPVGYKLVGWLLRPDGTAFRLPDVTGPPPEYASLLDADVELMEGVVTETGILDANVRVVAGEAGVEFSDFVSVLVTLEPKCGTGGPGPIPLQIGALPEE
jgi:hypothetical protein